MSNSHEELYLSSLLQKIKLRIDEANQDIVQQDHHHRDLQSYITSSENLDKFELLHVRQQQQLTDKRGYSQVLHSQQLYKMLSSPYFGAIDYHYDGDDEIEIVQFYIGRFGFSDDEGNILVNDWRAPISNMYYEFDNGRAYYYALGRKYEGELKGKRQYKIDNGVIQYIIDSTLVIQDPVLQETLHQNTSSHMKTIVTTIQREQNRIVRNESADTMIIQGVAGSGKTAVALHRIAYLLYRFKDTLTAEQVVILSPNKVFGDYISTVLPELGEDMIRSFTLDELTKELLPDQLSFQSFEQELTSIIDAPDSPLALRAKIKANHTFASALSDYLLQLNQTLLLVQTLSFVGYEFDQEYITSRFMSYIKEPVLKRIQLVASDIIDVLQSKRNGELKLPKKQEIIQKLSKQLKYQSPYDIYESFSEQFGREHFSLQPSLLEFNDVYPYLMCQLYYSGLSTYEGIQYFVLDEMQDYTPVQYKVLEKIFSCKRTLIGDFGQALVPYETITKSSLESIFSNTEYLELKTSYRTSYEISTYANKFTLNGAIHPIDRHGDEPVELDYHSLDEMLSFIDQYRHNSYQSTAVICKSSQDVRLIAEHLQGTDYVILDSETKKYRNGLILTTIQYAKGLEFDVVIMPFVSKSNYSSLYDKGLLYIVATRAMHQLVLLNDCNDRSPLI